MAEYKICTNIPGNEAYTRFQVTEVHDTDGGIVAHLRDVVVNKIIEADLLASNFDGYYSDEIIKKLTDAAKDGRSTTLKLYETYDQHDQVIVHANEKNSTEVEN